MATTRATPLLWLVFASYAVAQHGKLAPDLAKGNSDGRIEVIVQYRSTPSEEHHGRVERKGGQLRGDLPSIKAAIYGIPVQAAASIAEDPDVEYISPDRPVEALLDVTGTATGAAYAHASGWNGTGIGIAVIDSGVLSARDLLSPGSTAINTSRVVYSQNFVKTASGTLDQYGHGTHVAGIAAGNANASTGPGYLKAFRGVATNANIINLRVLDAKGVGTDSAVIAAIDKAIQLKNQLNIRVMNLSVGRPVFESYTKDPLCQAVERAWKAGIVVVVSAGNDGRNQRTDGYATITSPGNDPLVITVGAMKANDTPSRADDLIASYSSKGPTLLDHIVKPDLVAPGNRIISLVASKSLIANSSTTNRVPYSYYQNTSSKTFSGDYYKLSGTSMAAPMVAGAAAVMLHKDWSLSPDTIKARLMRSATKTFPAFSVAIDPISGLSFTTQYDLFSVGAGYLDITAALNDTAAVDAGSTAASPTAVFDAATNTVRVVNTVISGKAALWGSAAMWGSAAVWGSNTFVDGQAAMWGSSTVLGSAAVWGTGGVQGNAAIWGTAAIWGSSTTPGGETLVQLINGEK